MKGEATDANGSDGRLPTNDEINEALNNSAEAARRNRAQNQGQRLLGFALTQDCLQNTVDIMKRLPWEDVYKIVPQLVQAQPIYAEPATPQEPTED